MSSILVVDDEPVIRTALGRLLDRHGHRISVAGSVAQAENENDLASFDLIIADLRLPGEPGTELIVKANGTPVLIMTSYASVKSAVDSMRQGAVDYIAKPFDHDEMVMVVDRIIKEGRLQRQNAALKSDVQREYPVSGMIGQCTAMKSVFAHIEKVAPTDANVLILGESGTGKELVARSIHEKSQRNDAPIVTVNCAAIPEDLLESELFGHEKGSFTGAVGTRTGLVESADGGTLFLDEVAELSRGAQAGLLRVLQDGEIRRVGANTPRYVDVRLLAATHRALDQLVQSGRFREDLYFRLRVVEIALPPLRERGKDLIELANCLVERVCEKFNRPALSFNDEALAAIKQYHWPGKVREMDNAIERAVILAEGQSIDRTLLAIDLNNGTGFRKTFGNRDDAQAESLDEYFCRFVRDHETQMTETELAKRLGISRKTLWERRQRLGIPRRKNGQ